MPNVCGTRSHFRFASTGAGPNQENSMRSFLVSSMLFAGLCSAVPALMPIPASLEWRDGALALDNGFRLQVQGFHDARLDAAVERFSTRLSRQTGMNFASPATSSLRIQAS